MHEIHIVCMCTQHMYYILYSTYHYTLHAYVIVIVRLVCDMAQTQHEAQGRKVPEGECCV